MSSPDRPEPPCPRVVCKIRDGVPSGRLAERDTVLSARRIAADRGTPQRAFYDYEIEGQP